MATKAQLAAAAKKKATADAKAAGGKTPPAAPAAQTVDMPLLADINAATQDPARQFTYKPKDAALAALVAAGFVEVREDIVDAAGAVAARSTAAGMEALTAPVAAAPAAPAMPFATPPAAPAAPVAAAAPAAPAPAAASAFKIVSNLPVPAAKRFGKASVYPFDSLEVGQAFFVPATAERPNPAKSMASTVNSATARYAVEDGKDADGVTPKFKYTKRFTLRNVQDGKDFGFAGVKGAGVWRTA